MGDSAQSKAVAGRVNGPAAADYDELPYLSMPIGYSHPARLAAMAHLFGLPSAPTDSARVLELGCATGGNIIPLAARFPRATFVGIDLSAEHVAAAERRIAALGLVNIKIRQGNLATASFAKHSFDFVICHGVFSWVPAAAQDAILRICRDSLSDQGVAAISYNVLPGWHQRRVVRDLCLLHTRGESSAKARVAKARKIIAELAATMSPANPYGLLICTEAERLKTLPASYILGEFLSPDNMPFTFQNFTERAARFGLGYVSECDLPSSYPETLIANAASRVRALAGADPNALQTYTDVFSGRTFRRSLLVRRKANASPKTLIPARMLDLHVSSFLRRSAASGPEGAKFKDQHGRLVATKNPGTQEALSRLGRAYPASLAVGDLLRSAAGANNQKVLADELFELVLSGSATLTSMPVRAASANVGNPVVWPLARAEAASGQPWVTSPLHSGVTLNKVLTVMLPLMDGSNGRPVLQAAVAAALKSGQLDDVKAPAARAAGAAADPDAIAADYVQRGTAYLAINGLLDAEPQPEPPLPRVVTPPAQPQPQTKTQKPSRKHKKRKK